MLDRRPGLAEADAVLAEAVVAFLRESPGRGARACQQVPSDRPAALQRAVARAVVTVGGDSALALTLDSFASLCNLVIEMIEVGPRPGDLRR